jgi:hypothetical protein
MADLYLLSTTIHGDPRYKYETGRRSGQAGILSEGHRRALAFSSPEELYSESKGRKTKQPWKQVLYLRQYLPLC